MRRTASEEHPKPAKPDAGAPVETANTGPQLQPQPSFSLSLSPSKKASEEIPERPKSRRELTQELHERNAQMSAEKDDLTCKKSRPLSFEDTPRIPTAVMKKYNHKASSIKPEAVMKGGRFAGRK